MAESSYSSFSELPSVVVDLGTRNIRTGFSEEVYPRSIFPNMIGVPKKHRKELKTADSFVGDQAQKRRGVLSQRYPVQRGIVTDWDAMETVMNHMYSQELRVDPKNHSVFMMEAPLNPASNRERMAQLMFEKFETPAFYIGLTSPAAFDASGRGRGVVLSCGEGVTSVHPIWSGFAVQHAIKRSEFSGIDLTFTFSKLLSEKGCSFSTAASLEIVREMKEKLCYCATDYEVELTRTEKTSEIEQTYELPDGQIITVAKERFQCPEVLFNPSLIGSDCPGLADLVLGCIRDCEINFRNDLRLGIVLEGGTTMLPGFPERLKHDLVTLLPPSVKVNVMAAPERETLTWIGGSIISSLTYFQPLWVTKLEYEESGPNIVNQKCPGIC